jgi:Fic family protein
MKIPMTPPDADTILYGLLNRGPGRTDTLARVFDRQKDAAPGGRYRHWDKLRQLTPPEGLDHEQWWLSIKLARRALSQPIPLRDMRGRPFTFAMPDIAQQMVHGIDRRASGSIEAAAPLPADKDRHGYLLRSLLEEPITSSQLEGAATTRKVAKHMLREQREPRDRGERMIVNNHLGMRFIAERTSRVDLTPDLVRELHGILTDGTLDDPAAAGRFRRDDEGIVVQDMEGGTLHAPPPAAELPGRLQALCEFANDISDSPFIHPVARSILLHFWLAYDHPFIDGNGRTARALFYWSMARRGYWLMEYVSISRRLLRARSAYNRAFLYTETDDNDATYFLLHQMRIILHAIDDLHAYLDSKMEERRRSLEILRSSTASKLGLNHRQLALVRHGLDHPGTVYSIQEHAGCHNVSYGTARSDLLGVAYAGLFVQAKSGRAFRFLAPEDLDVRLGGGLT